MTAALLPAPHGSAPAPSTGTEPVPAPVVHTAEHTTTVVIGSGFTALAVAAELNRQGIKAVVMDSVCPLKQQFPPQASTGGISLDALSERSEIVRLLEHYARRHHLDIRPETQALELTRAPRCVAADRPWKVRTAHGTLSAHSVIFTRGALGQLHRVLHSAGVTTAADVRAGMHSLSLYLVGVGGQAVPTTQEILHQARRAGRSISARVAMCEPGPALA